MSIEGAVKNGIKGHAVPTFQSLCSLGCVLWLSCTMTGMDDLDTQQDLTASSVVTGMAASKHLLRLQLVHHKS